MSLARFVYYSAIIAGWGAFLAWVLAETFVLHAKWVAQVAGLFSQSLFSGEGIAENVGPVGTFRTALVGGVIGAAIGVSLNIVSAMANAQWKRQRRQLPFAILGGLIGGLFGGAIGDVLYNALQFPRGFGWIPRAFGWMIMGLAIGGTEGLLERSSNKLRNGLIGGGLGGLLGGIFFSILVALAGSAMAGRATGFVILGVSIGALIGLTMVVLKDAWLTVMDGFRPGRELILDQTVTVLGRGDHLPLPLLGISSRNIESEHARITRTSQGGYVLEDNHSRLGTMVNNHPIQSATTLADGDLIKLGGNILCFHSREGRNVKRAPRRAPAVAAPGPPTSPNRVAPPPTGLGPPGSQPPAPQGAPPPLPGVHQPTTPSIPQVPPPPTQGPIPGPLGNEPPQTPPRVPSPPGSHPHIPPPPPPPQR